MRKERSIVFCCGWWVFARFLMTVLCGALIYIGCAYLDDMGFRMDLTAEQWTKLSDGTIQTLQTMEKGMDIHMVFSKDTQSELRSVLEAITESYTHYGPVTVDVIDPITEPWKINMYKSNGESIPEGSVIISSKDNSDFRVVTAKEMYLFETDTNGLRKHKGIAAEQKLTSALRSMENDQKPEVLFLSGHKEVSIEECSELVKLLEDEGYNVESYSLQDGELPENSVLLVLSPVLDLTDAEASTFSMWLDHGGRLFYVCDATLDMKTMPNFSKIAMRFSLSFEPGIVVESGNMPDRWVSSPLYVMPEINEEATANRGLQNSGRILVPGSRAVSGPDIPLSGYTYETLLSTSEEAYIKRTDSNALVREYGDPEGLQQLAVSVQHFIEEENTELRAVLMGSLYTVVDSSLLSSTSNFNFTLSVVNFLTERDNTVNVSVREIFDTTMPVPNASSMMLIFGILLAPSLLVILIGIAVIMRRRKR